MRLGGTQAGNDLYLVFCPSELQLPRHVDNAPKNLLFAAETPAPFQYLKYRWAVERLVFRACGRHVAAGGGGSRAARHAARGEGPGGDPG